MTSRPSVDPIAAEDLAEFRRLASLMLVALDDVGARAELLLKSTKRALKPDEPTTALLAARAIIRRLEVARELIDQTRDDAATVERWL